MRAFQEREGRAFVAAIFVLLVISLVVNYAAGADLGIQNWSNQNLVVLLMAPPLLLALFLRAAWAQFFAAASFLGLNALFLPLYYPVLR